MPANGAIVALAIVVPGPTAAVAHLADPPRGEIGTPALAARLAALKGDRAAGTEHAIVPHEVRRLVVPRATRLAYVV